MRRGLTFGVLAVLVVAAVAGLLVRRGYRVSVVGPSPAASPEATTTAPVGPPSSATPPPEARAISDPLGTVPSPVTVASAPPVSPDAPQVTVAEGPRPTGGRKAARGVPVRPAKPPRGPAEVPAAPAPGSGTLGGVQRRFVLGTTLVESLKGIGRDLDGFDVSGVGVKRAPEVNGRVDLYMVPALVSPGDAYTVRVYLRNEGTKDIRVAEMKVQTMVDGRFASQPIKSRAGEIRPGQRALLDEVRGVWPSGVKSWSMEVVVASRRQDVYRNQLVWK